LQTTADYVFSNDGSNVAATTEPAEFASIVSGRTAAAKQASNGIHGKQQEKMNSLNCE